MKKHSTTKKGAAPRRLRGKQKAPTKVPLYIRIDPAALDAWRATGKGWQTRLADSIASHAPFAVAAGLALMTHHHEVTK